jgi:hypothetical protein
MKMTDDIRILVALRDGNAVNFYWYGTERPRFSLDRVEDTDGRWRNVAHRACWRLIDAGLIDCDHMQRPLDYGDWSSPYRLTDAGKSAAAELGQVLDDIMFAPVKRTPPEKLDRARHLRHSKQVISALTFKGCRIRDCQVKRVSYGGQSLQDTYFSGTRFRLPDGVMEILHPHLEAFVDVDGKESLRITEAGIAATAKRQR